MLGNKTYDVSRGDTFEHAIIGDTIINWYGETGVIVGEIGSVWLVLGHNGTTYPVFKYDPSRVVMGA
jgi:hypothetical protein